MKLSVRQGDISNQPDIDAIVNAANTELWLGGGVAGAIARRGGPEIEREAVAKGPIRLGDAVETTAGKLPNKYVIHAAAMGYRDADQRIPKRTGSLSSAEIIHAATTNSLKAAQRLGCGSIAFPALATGVARYPLDECARVMIKAALDYSKFHAGTSIEEVVFILFTPGDYQVFEQEFKGLVTE